MIITHRKWDGARVKRTLIQIGLTIYLIGATYWMLLVVSTLILPRGNPIAPITTAIIGQSPDFVAYPRVAEKIENFDDFTASRYVNVFFGASTIIAVVGLFTLTKGRNPLEKLMLLQAYALPRQREHWGKVIDASTQKPISFAVVRLIKVDGTAETNILQTVADLDGKYRIHLPKDGGTYFVEADSSDYRPKRQKATSTLIDGDDSVRANLLMEKVSSSKRHNSLRHFLLVQYRNAWLNMLTGFIMIVSLLSFMLGLYNLIFHFGFISVGNFTFYSCAFWWNVFVLSERFRVRAGRFINVKTNQPLASVGGRLLLTGGKAIVQFSDKSGRVRFDVEAGEYELQVSREGFMVKDNPANTLRVRVTKDGYLAEDIFLAPWRDELVTDSALPNPFG